MTEGIMVRKSIIISIYYYSFLSTVLNRHTYVTLHTRTCTHHDVHLFHEYQHFEQMYCTLEKGILLASIWCYSQPANDFYFFQLLFIINTCRKEACLGHIVIYDHTFIGTSYYIFRSRVTATSRDRDKTMEFSTGTIKTVASSTISSTIGGWWQWQNAMSAPKEFRQLLWVK